MVGHNQLQPRRWGTLSELSNSHLIYYFPPQVLPTAHRNILVEYPVSTRRLRQVVSTVPRRWSQGASPFTSQSPCHKFFCFIYLSDTTLAMMGQLRLLREKVWPRLGAP